MPRSMGYGSRERALTAKLRVPTFAQRLQNLQDMLDFNAEAEARNPRLRWAAAQLRRQLADETGEGPAPSDDL
jgi:hypothetical protein